MAYIYLLENSSFPGTVKIGCTKKEPEERATELYTTGVPTPFKVVEKWNVDDKEMLQIEQDIHELLRGARVGSNREFFRLETAEARKAIEKYFGKLGSIRAERERYEKKNNLMREYIRREEELRKEASAEAYAELGVTKEELASCPPSPATREMRDRVNTWGCWGILLLLILGMACCSNGAPEVGVPLLLFGMACLWVSSKYPFVIPDEEKNADVLRARAYELEASHFERIKKDFFEREDVHMTEIDFFNLKRRQQEYWRSKREMAEYKASKDKAQSGE